MARLLKITSALMLASVLAGCETLEPSDVALESRTIALEQNAEPAGVGTAGAVSHLLPQTGPTYVTLTVTAVDKASGTALDRDRARRAITSGSGFLVGRQGYVMTAAHVAVTKGNLVSARAANGRIYSGSVVEVNPGNDMAVVKLRGYSGLAAKPAQQSCLSPGSLVFSLGKPHEQGDTARVGELVSMRFGRPVSYGKFGYPDAMVMRMSTQKGESGGPVFDKNGQLVGMVVSTLSDQTGKPINLAHAVYAASLAKFLCSHITCDAEWAATARQTPEKCGSL
jgi:S1-C subfamily serine protease